MLKIRRPLGRLIFNMGIAIPGKTVFLIETATSAWWCHQMETNSALLVLCEWKPPLDSPHKLQWRGALMFSLICAWTNGWQTIETPGLRRHRPHYDVTVMDDATFVMTTLGLQWIMFLSAWFVTSLAMIRLFRQNKGSIVSIRITKPILIFFYTTVSL